MSNAGAVSYLPTTVGNTQQRLNGSILTIGGQAVQSSETLIIDLLGDSNTADVVFREEFWKALRTHRGKLNFTGSAGLGSVTGGSVGRRFLGDWRHDGFSGRRLTRNYLASITSSTFTSIGHDLALAVPLVFTSIDPGITGISINTLYWATNVVGNNFQIAATQGGSALTITGSGNVTVGTGLLQMWNGIAALHDPQPNIIIIKIGTNDIASGATAADCLSSLSSLIDAIRSTYLNAQIIISSINQFAPGSVTLSNQTTWNAIRNDYVNGILSLVQTKDSKVGFINAHADVNFSDFNPDGIHLLRIGYAKEANTLALAIRDLSTIRSGLTVPRSFRLRPAQASMTFDTTSDVVSIPYNSNLSPENQSFAFGFWYYPTLLQTDNTFRTIVKYANNHPNGFALGHSTPNTSSNGGSLAFYLVNGSPVFSGGASTGYTWEALKLNQWHRIVIVCDRDRLRAGLFINGQLVVWSPITSSWNITETEQTRFGAAVFQGAQGHLDRYFFAKGSNLTVNNAMEYVEKDYYEGLLFPNTTAYYTFSEGTGTSVVPQTVGLSNGTLTNVTWLSSGSLPKIVDE